MSSKGLTFLAFIAGAGIGSVCTWQLLKRKYELIAQEEIDSVKVAYAERESGKEFRDGLKVAEDRTPKEVDDMAVSYTHLISEVSQDSLRRGCG